MNGIINLYKPLGITSFDAVSKVKKISGEKKVGHTGTLDPLASGVLPICIGKATKLVDYIMQGEKIYKVKMKLGEVTDTYDKEGKIISESKVEFDSNEVTHAIMSFKGEIMQVPPMYSALKVNGKRLYELARAGVEVEREARKINIYDITIQDIDIPFVTFTARCSKGTYIRSLCFDIGQKLGCGAVMYELERCASGIFNIDDSVKLEDLTKENFGQKIIPIDKCLYKYPSVKFDEKFEKLLINGVAIKDRRALTNIDADKVYSVYNKKDEILGLASLTHNGFKILKLLT
ncbi:MULTISPECIES: tRNA pseudouridine(55) synthase TruB [Clostridium]|uniref:tRNA pseudouridine(55) synthase TruB n=1 Tax=Clostridium TaxID=1485 RepID=UPI00069FFE88|nr:MULTISPECIES: tRNA pseudouridine(55) synthase TruB [Clostridium]KOF56702.1 tRNA pseudouridine synthase B [Clostridium sp. DMHC 10]MCD2345964.1 tRNA pseudouridine(55) synthase TruB [Clostridium guangxiense]